MTTILEKALQEAQALPESEQDWLGQLILETLQDEQEWNRQFGASHDMLVAMADEALTDHAAGRTRDLSA